MQHNNNAEKIIDAISAKLLGGTEAKTDLEKMVSKLCVFGQYDLEEYLLCRNDIVKYIQSVYVV